MVPKVLIPASDPEDVRASRNVSGVGPETIRKGYDGKRIRTGQGVEKA